MTIYPDVDTPFADEADVVERLLPYHVFQHPRQDLDALLKGGDKGKGKATEADLLREEIRGERQEECTFLCLLQYLTRYCTETRFAIECHSRLRKLEERYRTARVRTGKVS